MGNPISDQIKTGTVGELLVQIRLLQYDVQAAPPLKDSGNDLVAVRGEAFRGIQVKTTTRDIFRPGRLPEYYHILAYVQLSGEDDQLYLDQTRVLLIGRQELENPAGLGDLRNYEICRHRVDLLFGQGT